MMKDCLRVVRPKILPARPGSCATCATDHPADLPHNVQSLFYQTRFALKWGRAATWADACAHLSAANVEAWRAAMATVSSAAWSDPPDGAEPIREPYAVNE